MSGILIRKGNEDTDRLRGRNRREQTGKVTNFKPRRWKEGTKVLMPWSQTLRTLRV